MEPAKIDRTPRPVLIYDGRCRLCRRWADRLNQWTRGRLALVSYHAPGVLKRYGLKRNACERSIHYVGPDKRTATGADAVFQSLSWIPGMGRMSRVSRVPGLRQAGEAIYRWISRHRRQMF